MEFDVFLSELRQETNFEYQGSRRGEFRGMAFSPRRKKFAGLFMGFVEQDWGEFAYGSYSVKDSSMNRVLGKLRDRGARGVIVPRRFKGASWLRGVDAFFVDNTLEFSKAAARVALDHRGSSVVTVVTGSAGKSTTRKMLLSALQASMPQGQTITRPWVPNTFPSVLGQLSRVGSYDHTLVETAGGALQFMRENDFSMSADVSVFTSVSEAHLEKHGTLEGVVRDKSEIFSYPPPGGIAIINLDSPLASEIVHRATAEGRSVLTYGQSPDAAIRLLDWNDTTGVVTAALGRRTITYGLGAPGLHMALNSLAVIATLRAYRYPDWRAGVAALESFSAITGRGASSHLTLTNGAGTTLIDEAYNANPTSMRAALSLLKGASPGTGGRRVAVLGDMRDLGEGSDAIHRGLADSVIADAPDILHLYGEHMLGLHEDLQGNIQSTHWESLENLISALNTESRNGDVILIKRGVRNGSVTTDR